VVKRVESRISFPVTTTSPRTRPNFTTHGNDGSKDLLDHGDRLGVLGEDDGRLNVETLRVVPSSSGDDFTPSLLGLFDHPGDLGERRSTDDGTDKVLPFGRRTDGDLGDFFLHDSLKLGPHGFGHVSSGQGGTLLSLVFEPSSDGLEDTDLDVGRRVIQVEVFTSGLSDDPGVSSVSIEVHGNVLPELLEDVSGSGKVKTGKLSVIDTLLDDLGRVTGSELDDTGGQTGLEQMTTLPMMAGAKTRLPPMAVKLKGVTARTNPSRGLYSVRLGKKGAWLANWKPCPHPNLRARLTSRCWPSS
jgi:hypothetical protein